MTLAAIARRLPTTALAGVVVGALLGSGGTMALTAAQPDSAPCVVPANPGTYTCTVVVAAPSPTPVPSVVEPTPTPSPTAAPTPTPTPRPTPSPTPVPTPTAPPSSAQAVYGPGIIGDTLANTQVGGTSCGCANLQTAYRFTSLGGQLTSARFYVVDGSGYAGGSGGTIRVTVQTDANGQPSGTVLASTTIASGNPVKTGYLPAVTFASPATLSAGQPYDLVFTNTDAKPTVNYVSVNSLYVYGAAVQQPRDEPTQLLNDGHGWAVRANYLPIVDLGYANGQHQGQGYMQIDSVQTIGSLAVHITPSVSRTVSHVALRVERVSGSGALTISLGSATATVPASSVAQHAATRGGPGMTTVSVTLSAPVTLVAGQATTLTLSAPSGTQYATYELECGVSGYHFSPATCWTDRSGGDDVLWWAW